MSLREFFELVARITSMTNPSVRLLGNLLRDTRFAWRSLRKAPLVALTIVTTVGLGLGLVAVVFTILNLYVFKVDEVRDPYGLFAVDRQRPAEAPPETYTRVQYETLVRETGVFAEAYGATTDMDTWIEGSRLEGPLVTGNFFQVLGVSAAIGRPLMPADDEPGQPPVIVLSHPAWERHFASDPGVLNRTVRVNGAQFRVVGVMREGFRGLVPFPPDFWAPLSLANELGGTNESGGKQPATLQIVGRLKPGVSRRQALAQLTAWDARRGEGKPGEPRKESLLLEPQLGTVSQKGQMMLLFLPLFFAFGLILMIGCANVANLLLARGVARQREIGIRLAMGAPRSRLIGQLLTESLLLALVSAALGFGISQLTLHGVVYAMTSTFPPEVGNLRISVPPPDWRVGLFLVVGAMASTLAFALAPALQATRVDLIRAIHGGLVGELVRSGRPGRARNALVAVQVTGSVLLLICAAIFLRSSWAAAAIDPGIRTVGIVNVKVLNEQRRGAILEVVKSEPTAIAIAASWPSFLGGMGRLPGLAEAAAGKQSVTYQFVSPEYFGVSGINVVRGRGFAPVERSTGAAVAVVSETTASQLWPGANAVGQTLRLEPDLKGGPRAVASGEGDDPQLLTHRFIVVGVTRDVPGFRLGAFRLGGAGVYVPISTDAAKTSFTMYLRGDAERARHTLVDRLAAVDPNMGEVTTMQTIARGEAYLLGIPFWLTLVLGALALLLALSGLFSMLSYLVEQRTREIGVRMAIGATRRSIVALVLSQSARPVGLGLLLGSIFTGGLGAVLLATPVAEQIGSSVRLFDPVAYAVGLIWIAGACACAALVPALRASRIDPLGALRQD